MRTNHRSAWVARIGYLARGIVFLIIGGFALLSALGAGPCKGYWEMLPAASWCGSWQQDWVNYRDSWLSSRQSQCPQSLHISDESSVTALIVLSSRA